MYMKRTPTVRRNIVFYKGDAAVLQLNDFVPLDNQAIQRGSAFGKCLVCGHEVLFDIGHPNLRETLVCPICKSYNRQRQIVAALSLELFGTILDLKTIIRKMKRGSRILLLESVTNLAEAFRYYAGRKIELYTTEYIDPKLSSGSLGGNGIMHLDIEKTHFKDSYFDLVIHADVFEHVANAPVAEKEQVRILKKGGKAIYTAPFEPFLAKDDIYAEVQGGKIKYYKEAVYHGDPAPREDREAPEGCLVFRVFSYPDTWKRYKQAGAKFRCRYLYVPQHGIIGNNAYVFVATKK
jgi:SAM-dependent methyltransferase